MLLDLYDFQCFSYIYSVFSCFLLVAQTRFLVFYSVSTHCCMLSERFLKNLALLRRNAFLLRSTCLLYDLLLPRLDLLVFYSVFRRSPYLRIFSRFSNNRVFHVFPVHVYDFQRFFVPELLEFYGVFMTIYEFSTKHERFIHILRVQDTLGVKCVERAMTIE